MPQNSIELLQKANGKVFKGVHELCRKTGRSI